MKPKKLDLAQALSNGSTDKRIEVLNYINEFGSISEAARVAGISYKAAWQAIEMLSNLAGAPLLEKAVGGSGGGGAHLTEAGKQVLTGAAILNQARTEILATLEKHNAGSVKTSGFASLSLRTSMRNSLPCKVKAITKLGTSVRVVLDLGDGNLISSKITKESVQLLGLKNGMSVLALCKATGVTMTTGAKLKDGTNLITGEITRISNSVAGGELSIKLSSGHQLVGFAPPKNGFTVGKTVSAVVDESAIVIALSN